VISNALIFLVQTICDFFAGALLLRFWMQWARAPFRNPLSEFLRALTNFAVLPARRVIPGLWGHDLATLVLAWFILLVETTLLLLIKGYALHIGAAGALVAISAVMLLRVAVYLVMFVIFMLAILSWVNPHNWMGSVLTAMARPMLRPLQRIVPPVGAFDLTPLIALIVCQLILMLPLAYLEGLAGRLL